MQRLIFLFVLLCFALAVAGQNVTIQKSADVVVIRGKSYYLHTVQPGQTLFSLCKAYGVSLEEVKAMNDKKDDNLSLYEVLKIPFVESGVQQDNKYSWHRVERGETIYSIARRFNLKPKELLKYNPEYSHNEPLAVGAVVRIPLGAAGQDVASGEGGKQVGTRPVLRKEEEKKEDWLRISDSGAEFTGREQKKEEGLPADSATWIEVDRRQEDVRNDLPVVGLPSASYVKIALLLPLSAGEYPSYPDSLQPGQSVTISSRSEQFISFYEGVLLAVDSLKNKGYKIDLHVFDTERNVEKSCQLARRLNEWQPDLVLGPVYGSEYKALADNLENKNIPLIYPLSSRAEHFNTYPNFVQVNASLNSLAEEMAEWTSRQVLHANVVQLCIYGEDASDSPEKQLFKDRLGQVEGVGTLYWAAEEILLDSLRYRLLPDRENILILPTVKETEVSKVLPLISTLTDGYRITVVGLPEWQTFSSVDHETFYKLNTKLFTYSYVDYAAEPARRLAEKYRLYFHTEPGSLVYKAFDMGMYFIGLAAQYRERALEALSSCPWDGSFSRFRFGQMEHSLGKENRGFFVVNFASDYTLRIHGSDL
jgi:LysM repeat protein